MNKKILGVFVGLLVVIVFAVPALATSAGTSVTYYTGGLWATYPKIVFCGESGNSLVKSNRGGFIMNEAKDTNLFVWNQFGSVMTSSKDGTQVWHLKQLWTVVNDETSGFQGSLNGKGVYDSSNIPPYDFTVSGVLTGFGDLQGQKLFVEYASSGGKITGILATK